MKRKAPEPATSSGLPDNTWTAQQVADWLSSSKYAGMKDALQGVNGKMLLSFTKAQLKTLGQMVGVALYNKLHAGDAEAPGT